MQQEDDLRALAKIMDFLRAVSILLVVMNIYWYCYESILAWGVNIGVVDKILMNFDRTAHLFHSMLYTKFFAVVLLGLSCLGTMGVKDEKITWLRIGTALAAGFVLFFLNGWLLALPFPLTATMLLYVATTTAGYVCLLMAGLWASRLLKNNLMDDVFNNENESFQQETRLLTNEYSVNLPTRFYYRKRWNRGWINIVNPFRATIVLGTPVGNLFQIRIEFLITQYRQQSTVGQRSFVFLQKHFRYFQQRHVYRRLRLMSVRHDPQLAVERGADIFLGQIPYVDIGQSRKAREDKYVTHLFQPYARHLLLKNALQFFFGQIAAVYFLQPDAIVGERIVEDPAVVLRLDDNHAERLQKLGRCILTALLFRPQILFEAHKKRMRYFFQCHIFHPIFRLNELFHSSEAAVVFAISGRTLADAYQLLYIFVMSAECSQQRLLANRYP